MHWFIIFVFLASVYGGKETNVDVLKLITDVGEEIFIQWESLSKTNINIEQDRILLESLNNIGRQISRLEILMQTGKDTSPYKQLLQKPQMNRVLQQLHVLAEPLRSIDGFHSTMMQYANLPEASERLTIENFARTCISHGDGALAALLMRIHALVVPDLVENGNLEKSIFTQLAQELEEPSRYLCSLQQSPQQVLYNIYSTITLTEIKGYTMMQFSWMLLKIYGKGNFTLESILARETFEKRSSASLNILKSSLSLISRELWRCDPDNHVEGETYVALTRLLQGYVANEVDLSADHSCCGDCAAYSLTPPRNCHYKNEFCAKQPACSGTLHNCVFIKSKMEVCQANPSSYRRYEWIEYDDGLVLGQKKTCTQGVSKVKSWWTWSLRQCTYCMCMCDQEGPDSHRHFSLQDVTASSDKVVTGIRFTKVNKVIHLQISEGTLLPRGKIDLTSVKWKTFTPVPEPESNPQGRDVDYHTMSYEERSIDLDDLEGPEGTLLTGVRFRKVGSHLNFEIRVTLFNFTTGKLISPLEKSKWINNNAYSILQSRTVLEQQEPTEWRSSFPDSHSGQYLDFTHSDLKTDAAQSTVPFLDSQPAMPLLPVPLSGAGIYHKSYYLYWGFVAPKLFTYDISRHLDNPHPQDTPVDVRFF